MPWRRRTGSSPSCVAEWVKIKLKTACNVGDEDIGPLVAGHLDEMHASRGRKGTWLVAFWKHRLPCPQCILERG